MSLLLRRMRWRNGSEVESCRLRLHHESPQFLPSRLQTVSPQTSNGEILAIVDSGTSKHILQCRTLLAHAKEAHVAVSRFAGDTSRSTYSGDLLCTVRTENGQLLPLSDTSSELVVPDAKRPLWSVRHAQLAGH